MSNIYNIHSSTGDCLTEQQMFDYIDNKLPPKDSYIVEKHLLDCELCSDAMEGLALVKDRNILKETRKMAENLVLSGPKKQGKVIQLWSKNKTRLAIAAGIILVGGTMMVLKYSMEQESARVFTENMQQERSPEVKPSGSTSQPLPVKDSAITLEIKKEKKIITKESPAIKENYTNDQAVALNEKKAEQSETVTEEVVEKPVLSDSKDMVVSSGQGVVVAAESNLEQQRKAAVRESREEESSGRFAKSKASKSSPAPSMAAPSMAESYKLEEYRPLNDTVNDADYSNGMKQYRAGNFSSALIFFQRFLSKKPGNSPAFFYSGVSQLNLGKTDEAMSSFDKVLHGTDQNFYEAAKYYMALIWIKKSERKKAKALLNEVISMNGEYRQRATDALHDLD
jgi:tetratricopeptide (TPR) repeat protein